jgi:molecular chaperone GrpE
MTKHKRKHEGPEVNADTGTEPGAAVTPQAAESADAATEPGASGVAGPPEAPTGPALVELPAEAVRRLEDEITDLKDRYLRLAAEFDNFRKRTQRERTETWSRAQAHVVSSVLDVLDDLARVGHLDPERTTVADVLSGVELVERKLVRELEAAGLERVGEAGAPFDPSVHEAVTTVPAPAPDQDHHVALVFQPGYRFGGGLLRPARVSVFVWQAPTVDGGGA